MGDGAFTSNGALLLSTSVSTDSVPSLCVPDVVGFGGTVALKTGSRLHSFRETIHRQITTEVLSTWVWDSLEGWKGKCGDNSYQMGG